MKKFNKSIIRHPTQIMGKLLVGLHIYHLPTQYFISLEKFYGPYTVDRYDIRYDSHIPVMFLINGTVQVT